MSWAYWYPVLRKLWLCPLPCISHSCCPSQTQPVSEASLSEQERLTTRLDDLEAKCLYCGGKMESVIATLQDEIPELPNLDPDTENTLFLAIAGLKQVSER